VTRRSVTSQICGISQRNFGKNTKKRPDTPRPSMSSRSSVFSRRSATESENHDIELGMPWPDWVNDCELLSNFNADSHGRVNLGPEYGDATVRVAVIEVVDDGDAD